MSAGGDAEPPLTIRVLEGAMSIARLPAGEAVPDWVPAAPWCSVTRTADELSIVCESGWVPDGLRHEVGWRLLQVEGPLDFSLTGVLHRITAPLKQAGISLFAVSTFDTDYVLVRGRDLDDALAWLRSAGIVVSESD